MCIEIFHQKITWEKPTFKGKFGERSASPTLWSCYSLAIQQANKSNHNLPQRAVSCLRHCKTLTSSRKTTPRRSSWESFQEKQIQDFSAKFGIVLVHALAHFRTGEPQSVNLIHLMPLQICWHLQSAPRCPVTNHATIIWFCTMWGMNRYEGYGMKRCNVLVKHLTRRRSDTCVAHVFKYPCGVGQMQSGTREQTAGLVLRQTVSRALVRKNLRFRLFFSKLFRI